MAIPAIHSYVQDIYVQVNKITVESQKAAIIYSVALKAIYLLSAFSVLSVLGVSLSFVFDLALFNKEYPQLWNKLKVMVNGNESGISMEMTSSISSAEDHRS
ncbi:MAG: hypothetical protein WCT85_06095 [Parachlamydiales bacterium]|jgi:hypothetical protein